MGFFPFIPLAPSGAAGGALTGTYPNPGLAAASVVAGVAGGALAPASVAATGALSSGTTLTATGIASENAGNNTSGSAPLITPTNANGTAAQLSDLTRDYMVYIVIGTAGTAFTLAIGPTSGVADSLVPSGTASSGDVHSFRLPAGWFWKWSATTATLAQQTAIGC